MRRSSEDELQDDQRDGWDDSDSAWLGLDLPQSEFPIPKAEQGEVASESKLQLVDEINKVATLGAALDVPQTQPLLDPEPDKQEQVSFHGEGTATVQV